MTLARNNKVAIDLPVSAREDGQKGKLLCVAFQGQVSAFEDAAAKQAELASKQTAAIPTTSTTETTAPPTAPSTVTPTATSTERAPVTGEREGADQEQETRQEAEEESGDIDEREDDEEPETPPVEKSGPVPVGRKVSDVSSERLTF